MSRLRRRVSPSSCSTGGPSALDAEQERNPPRPRSRLHANCLRHSWCGKGALALAARPRRPCYIALGRERSKPPVSPVLHAKCKVQLVLRSGRMDARVARFSRYPPSAKRESAKRMSIRGANPVAAKQAATLTGTKTHPQHWKARRLDAHGLAHSQALSSKKATPQPADHAH